MRRMTVAEFQAAGAPKPSFEAAAAGRIIAEVRKRGDSALREFSLAFDGVEIEGLRVETRLIEEAASLINPELESALGQAADNIARFARAQAEAYKGFEIEIRPGVFAGQVVVPIERVGIYVPGGRHPLVSSLLMGAVPAGVAGVDEVAVFTPPGPAGLPCPAILAAAHLCGVEEVYSVGGAQAVAAMAYGTESIRRVNKIFGPGNVYVTAAKKLVAGDVGVDFAAGPTELMILADRSASPVVIAADLVAQAEHDVLAAAVLVTDSEELAQEVEKRVEECLRKVRTAGVARRSLETCGAVVIVSSMEAALAWANERAPEHLALFTDDAERLAGRARNFGSLFIGERSAEALGDYSSGLNHILPTQGAARHTGGLSVRDFLKIQTTLRVKNDGLEAIGPAATLLAAAEGLDGHALSVLVRLGRGGP